MGSNSGRRAGRICAALLFSFAVVLVPSIAQADYFNEPYAGQKQYAPPSSAYTNCAKIAQQRSGYGGSKGYTPGAIEGAAAGAMAGSWIGGWNGNAGSGAGWGAAVGAVAGGVRKNNAKNEDNKRRADYDKYFNECMNYHQQQPSRRPPPTAPPALVPLAPGQVPQPATSPGRVITPPPGPYAPRTPVPQYKPTNAPAAATPQPSPPPSA